MDYVDLSKTVLDVVTALGAIAAVLGFLVVYRFIRPVPRLKVTLPPGPPVVNAGETSHPPFLMNIEIENVGERDVLFRGFTISWKRCFRTRSYNIPSVCLGPGITAQHFPWTLASWASQTFVVELGYLANQIRASGVTRGRVRVRTYVRLPMGRRAFGNTVTLSLK